MKVLITGGVGYIGSHIVLELLSEGHEVQIVDNLINSSESVVRNLDSLTDKSFLFSRSDVQDEKTLLSVFHAFRPDAVIHMAGLKAVGESSSLPVKYYEENLFSTIVLLKVMSIFDCENLIFSSSATVYGEAIYLPYDENHRVLPTNPYGRTKLFSEEIIRDWARAKSTRSSVLLRYFNPVGAHFSGKIGESPRGVPNNLMPIIAQVATGKIGKLDIFGCDYDTRDGSGERDYIHVTDLAKAHLAALYFGQRNMGTEVFNIGTGRGVTVLEMIQNFELANDIVVPYQIVGRRAGDVASSIASVDKAQELLSWRATLDLNVMCRSVWQWQQHNSQP